MMRSKPWWKWWQADLYKSNGHTPHRKLSSQVLLYLQQEVTVFVNKLFLERKSKRPK